jgi:1,4-alpha-glucan branching enzyme
LSVAANPKTILVVVCNFTPVPRHDYHIGVPAGGKWTELFNSDEGDLGGSDIKNTQNIKAFMHNTHNKRFTLSLTLPPLGAVYLKPVR